VGLVRRRRVELDVVGERTEVPELVGERIPDLTLVNDDDLTFAKIRLDPRSLAMAVRRLGDVKDPLARTLCWTACWDMTRDGEMRSRDYLRLVIGNIGKEPKVGVVQSLLAQAASAVYLYGDPANRGTAGQTLADRSLDGLRNAEPGSDHQLAWARSFISSARSNEHLANVGGLLEGSFTFEGLVIDTELRWHIVRSLAAAGAAGEDVIAAEADRDPTDRGASAAKDEAWKIIIEDTSLPLAMTDEIMAGFQQFGQEELLAPYAERFFEALPDVWERRDVPDALAFGRRMYPHLILTAETVEATDRYLAGESVPGPIRRLLLEGKDGVLRGTRARAVDAGA